MLLLSHSVVSSSLQSHGTAARQASLFFTNSQFAQTHVHWVSDAIQPTHPLWPASSPALNNSQHQSLFQSISTLHQVVRVLKLQHQSFKWIFRVNFFLGLTSLISLLSKGLSRVFSNSTVQKHQSFSAQPSLWFNSHLCTWLLEKL